MKSFSARTWMVRGTVVMGAVLLAVGAPSADTPTKSISLTPIGVYRSNVFNHGGAEIGAYDPGSKRLFVVNLDGQRVDVLDISTPSAPTLTHTIDITPWGSQANSVAVHNGVVAVAVEANVKTNPGKAVFFNAYGGLLAAVTVGALPDMLTFTPNGQLVLVANEGEPNSYGLPTSVDPEGSVSIIDLKGGAENLTDDDVTTASFTAFNSAVLDPSIRIFGPGASVAQDLEPEYIAVSHDSKTAWVTIQENNALAVIDLKDKAVTKLIGLGFKDHNVAGRGMDSSDRDSQAINITTRPVLGMYQPDGIAVYERQGKSYLVLANEGDARDWPGLAEARRVADLTLDATAFPNAAVLQNNNSLGRLQVTPFNGNTDADAAFEQLYSFGARSFSIRDENGALVFDSGDAIEQLIAVRSPALFNADHEINFNVGGTNSWTRDSRSDNKGPEPENVTIAKLWGREYAFIVLERVGGVLVYELGEPGAPTFVDYLNVRTVNEAPASPAAEDLGPEGVLVIPESASPNGKPLLVVVNEVSGTTRIFEIAKVKK